MVDEREDVSGHRIFLNPWAEPDEPEEAYEPESGRASADCYFFVALPSMTVVQLVPSFDISYL